MNIVSTQIQYKCSTVVCSSHAFRRVWVFRGLLWNLLLRYYYCVYIEFHFTSTTLLWCVFRSNSYKQLKKNVKVKATFFFFGEFI